MKENNLYRKKECELCGKYAFEKFIKTKAELDGGFTRIEEWEQSGFGSLVTVFYDIKDLKNSRSEFKLCPDCAKQIDFAIYNKVKELKKKYTEKITEGGE